MLNSAATRLVVIGNCGSGKSTLARRVGEALRLPVHDLDLLHWRDEGSKRDESEAKALVADLAKGPSWVIEGVYGWLAEVALDRATALIWLDLPWAECREALSRRGPRRGTTSNDQDALLAWSSAYWTRETPSSFTGHSQLYQRFHGQKARLRARAETISFRSERRTPSLFDPGESAPSA